MTAVLQASGLGKRYRRLWALADCTLSIPAGHVVGLVGPNGAGKTTLLNLATGMLAPNAGTIEVLGGRPGAGPAQLARVGYLAQDAPVYAYLIVMVASRVRVAGPVEELLATHHLLSGPRRDPGTLPAGQHVISASHTDRQTTLLVRTADEVLDPAWTSAEVTLEDLVLAYMTEAAGRSRHNHHLQVQR